MTFLNQLVREVLRRVLLGSMVGALFVWLLVTSNAWKAAASSLGQAEMAAAEWIAAASASEINTAVVTVGIDSDVYWQNFQGQSPLSRTELAAKFEKILNALPPQTVLAVDLDVSPPRGDAPWNADSLDRLWIQHARQVVLVQPMLNLGESSTNWVTAIQNAGVTFADPAINLAEGWVDTRKDLTGSLGQVAAQQSSGRDHDASVAMIDHQVLAQPVMLGWNEPVSTLVALKPAVVLVGGMWSGVDTLQTPFGPRHGVTVHAAKLSGYLQGMRTLPAALQVLAAILAAAFTVTASRVLAQWIAEKRPTTFNASLPLQVFFYGAMPRFVVGVYVAALCVLWFFTASLLRHWGWGLSSLMLIGFSLLSVVAGWVQDITASLQTDSRRDMAVPKTLKEEFWMPWFSVWHTDAASPLDGWRRPVALAAFFAGRTLLPLGAILYLVSQ